MTIRRLELLLALSLAVLAAAGGTGAHGPRLERPRSWLLEAGPSLASGQGTLTAHRRRTLGDMPWWGGTYTTPTGEHVTVHVSASYPHDEAVAQRWADYLTSLVHGPELEALTATLAPLSEVQAVCGEHTLGCYANDELVAVGDSSEGCDPTEVVAHEYGHHVAFHRSNAPWRAIEWGPKRWASSAQVCSRTASGTVFPGDEGAHYMLNPGEAFAESYRVLNETVLDGTFRWELIDASFRPDATALAAVKADVLQPWTAPTTRSLRVRFAGRQRTWRMTIPAPLDGDLHVTLRGPLAAGYSLTLDAGGAARARGALVSGNQQALDFRICGQRSLMLRVARVAQAPPAVRLTVTQP
jgi:hypothetical protein